MSIEYNIDNLDIICCLDSTKSMGKKSTCFAIKGILGCLSREEYPYQWIRNLKPDARIRYKLLIFRDYRSSGREDVIEQSPFLSSAEQLGKQIDLVDYAGGGDRPENALEALYLAMRSMALSDDRGVRRPIEQLRQVIILFTDSVPFRPEGRKNRSRRRTKGYPEKMPETLEEFKNLWNKGDRNLLPGYQPGCGRLVICAPFTNNSRTGDMLNWYQVTEGMDRTWFIPIDYTHEEPEYETDDFDQALAMVCAVHPDQQGYQEEWT